MTERKLPYSLAGLWTNSNGRLTIRYSDLNERTQQTLAKRIKESTLYKRIHRNPDITFAEIRLALDEINPIIFGETQTSIPDRHDHNTLKNCYTINTSGWRFKLLCKAIYLCVARVKKMNKEEFMHIAYLTTNNWAEREEYIDRIWPDTTTTTANAIEESEIGLEEMEQISSRIMS